MMSERVTFYRRLTSYDVNADCTTAAPTSYDDTLIFSLISIARDIIRYLVVKHMSSSHLKQLLRQNA